MKIYIAANKKFSAFDWGKNVISYITLFAKKYGMSIFEFNPAQPPESGYLIVVGVDVIWLEEIARSVRNTDLVVIQFIGKSDIFTNRVIKFTTDQKSVIEKSIELLQKSSRKNTAFFGVQRNDSSDLHKAEIFKSFYSSENVYMTHDKISDTFEKFSKKMSRYDSVICANDLMAVYLLKRLKKLGISVPEDVYVVGNGNLWIGAHISPTLTTAGYELESAMDIMFYLIRKDQIYCSVKSIDFTLNTEIIARETTGYRSENNFVHLCIPARENDSGVISDEEIREIRNVDRGMHLLSATDIEILKLLYTGTTYNEISEKVFLTPDSVKYHVKKIYNAMKVHDSTKLKTLLDDNLINVQML